MTPFATRTDIEQRYPREIVVLAADEESREVDWTRVDNALIDASSEVRAILAGRYAAAQIEDIDAAGRDVLRLFTIDIALYRVSLSFGRLTEAIKDRYEAAVKRLDQIIAGKGGFGLTGATGGGLGGDNTEPQSITSPNQVLIDVPPRVFTRARMGQQS